MQSSMVSSGPVHLKLSPPRCCRLATFVQGHKMCRAELFAKSDNSVMDDKLEVILVNDRSRGLKRLQTFMDRHPVVVNSI